MSEYIYEITTDSDGVDCYIKRGEIVRCKDCKYNDHFAGADGYCQHPAHDRDENREPVVARAMHYCGHGEVEE